MNRDRFLKLEEKCVRFVETPNDDFLYGKYEIKIPKRISRKQRLLLVRLMRSRTPILFRMIRRENVDLARKLFSVQTLDIGEYIGEFDV